jgi:hypothetical protein
MTKPIIQQPNVLLKQHGGLILLFLIIGLMNVPIWPNSVWPQHDTLFAAWVFCIFYSGFFFNLEIVRWLPYGTYGIPADFFQLGSITPPSYFSGLVGYVLHIKNALLMYKWAIALEELDKIRKTQIDKEELAQAKETFMNQFVFRFTTSASIVGQKVDIEYEGLPLDYLETYLSNVQTVTQEDVQRVARKYLHPDEIKILVVGNKEKFDKQLDSFGKVNVIELK